MKNDKTGQRLLRGCLLTVTLLLTAALSGMAIGGQGQCPPKRATGVVMHTVLLRFNPQATPALIQQALAQVRTLPMHIPGILSVAYGENFSPRSHGFTHGITLRFNNRAALEAFYPHAAHQQFITTSLKPLVAELLVMDYEEAFYVK